MSIRSTLTEFDVQRIGQMRKEGETWEGAARIMFVHFGYEDISGDTLRKRYWRAKAKVSAAKNSESGSTEAASSADASSVTKEGQSLVHFDRLLERLEVDTEQWQPELVNVRHSEWDMANGEKGESVKVSARFQRRNFTDAAVRDIWDAFIADITTHELQKPQAGRLRLPGELLCVLSVCDPHFGMLAYDKEVGDDYDLEKASSAYEEVSKSLLMSAGVHGVGRICMVVGNDLFHANSMQEKTPVTRRGTPQDFDTRFHKVFTEARRSVVRVTDEALSRAPVDIVIVPGNHDHDECYRLGEVLSAWYRNDPDVKVIYGANKRVFYSYYENAFMFTHGEEYSRKRDNLAMILLSEMPNEMLTASSHGLREVLTGHNHASMAGGYYPTAELTEGRGVRVRSLPGLTGTDAWHHEQGYLHHRAGTALLYAKGGGLHCLYEERP